MDCRKVNPWSNAEVQTFLCFAADESIRSELDSYRNERVYQVLSEKMALHGFERSSRQCREKLKKMKSEYFRIKKHNAENVTELKTSRWHSHLEAIYGRHRTALRPLPDVLPLPSLRLLVSPLQLMAAALWGVVQHKAVTHYGLLEDFIAAVLDIMPELLTRSERVQLLLGLRAKVVLEMCQSDDLCDQQSIEPHLKRIDDLINQEDEETCSSTIKASVANFIKLVKTLLEDPFERDMFYQETFPSVFGLSFDSALCDLVKKCLINLEMLLPLPSLEQTSLWLGLSPPVLKECGDILNQPEPLSELLQHHKQGFNILAVHSDNSIFSSFSKTSTGDTESEATQKHKISPPEEDVLFVEAAVDEGDTDPQDGDTSVAFVYQSESGSRSFSCLVCGQGFGSLFEMKRHSMSGCSANTGADGWRTENEHLLKDSEDNSKHRPPSDKSGEAKSGPPEALQPSWSSDASDGPVCKRSSRMKTCSVCGDAFTSAADLTNHMRAHTNDGSHVCGDCGEEFDNYENYMFHRENECKTSREHSMDDDYSQEMNSGRIDIKECAVILRRISDDAASSLKERNLFSCEECGQQFQWKDLTKHKVKCCKENHQNKRPAVTSFPSSVLIKACHVSSADANKHNTGTDSEDTTSNQSTMKCTMCEQTFSKLLIMRKHYQHTHNIQDEFPCPVCNRTFVRLYDLIRHHENKLLFQCDTCKWCYSSQTELRRHKTLFNDTCALVHVCEVCGKSYKNANHLKQHKVAHLNTKERPTKERPVCSYCGKSFSSNLALRVHMNRHTGGFSCSICAKVFHQKIFLRRHLDRHNGQEPYLCEICGKGWPTERYLQVHMTKHSDERAFVCDQCGENFKWKTGLQSHFRRKHTNNRPFNCSVCSRAFAFTKDLTRHMMKHTGTRPFVCSRCGKGFIRSLQLKKHQKTKCV